MVRVFGSYRRAAEPLRTRRSALYTPIMLRLAVGAVEAEEEVGGRTGVAAAGVELGEELGADHQEVDEDGDLDDAEERGLDRRRQPFAGEAARLVAHGEAEIGDRRVVVRGGHCREVAVRLRLQHRVFEHGARRDHLDHLAGQSARAVGDQDRRVLLARRRAHQRPRPRVSRDQPGQRRDEGTEQDARQCVRERRRAQDRSR